MLEIKKVRPSDCSTLAEIVEGYYSCCNNFSDKELEYILSFCSKEALKIQIQNKNFTYFFIKEDYNIKGFIIANLAKEKASAFEFLILDEYKSIELLKNATLEFSKVINKPFEIFAIEKNKKDIEFFEKLNFDKSEKMVLYIGSDIYLYGYMFSSKD